MTFFGFPFWLAVPCAIVAMALFGVLAERVVDPARSSASRRSRS
jgi:hypothetical protein